MSLVLAVEPDGKQAEILRRLVSQQGGTLILVTSAYAAAVTMNRRVPDLVLLGASLDQKAYEHVADHFILASDVPEPQTLRIPPQLTDPEAFGAEIAECLSRTAQQRDRRQPEPADGNIEQTAHEERAAIDPDLHTAQLAMVQAEAEARLASELERVRGEAAEERAAELARLQAEADAQLRTEVGQARAAAAADARNALTAELANARREAEQTLASELARVRAEAAQRLADELEDADALRSAAVAEARIAAEKTASLALDTEVERIRAESEARLTTEIRRVQETTEQARRAQEQTEAAAARALEAEVGRVRAESDTRLEAELTRAHQEAEARLAQQRAQVDVDAIRAAAAREARAAADMAAAHALETEVERVRTEADARLQEELARVLAEVEQSREIQHRAHIDAAAARDAAARAHEATAARAETEAHLRAQLERVREETDRARLADQSEMERVRGDAEREARARADAMLQAEIARARADAEARLASEVAGVRAEVERRRVAELAEIRAQLDQVRETARQQARSAAAEAISAEVARAEVTIPRAVAQVAAHVGSQAVSATAGTVGMVVRWCGRCVRGAPSAGREVLRRLPARTLPVAATLLFVMGGLAFVDVSSLTRRGTSLARSASGTAGTVFDKASQAVQTTLKSTDASSPLAPATAGTAEAPTAEAQPSTAGLLDVFSRVSLELYVSGRRVGTTEDGQIVLPPGRYRVGLVSTRLNYRGEATLEIRPGAVTSYNVSLPNGLLQLDTEPGAEVWIEGTRAGLAPLGTMPVPIGTREIVVRHPNLGERRAFVEVRYREVTTMSIPLREAPSDVP